MPTTYRGRKREFDLGAGHSFTWLKDKDGAFGLTEHHPSPDPKYAYCGGYLAWRLPVGLRRVLMRVPWKVNHQLVAGGPGAEAHLTIAPSLACRSCPSHGWIRDGKWVQA